MNSMSKISSSDPQWVETARKLREVREACLQFLDRWAIGHLVADEPAMDRVAGDVMKTQAEEAIADPKNRDWSILYRGSVLDD
jgi:hypothetical protein